ncbi:hypothetical protein DWB61_15225 [Ancylomarina euxinus]|uniref:WD40 repeat domain-containing protein n=1 Tax=Ancylomarina euxinus TaxID=2283627 RepID=A0A425XXJ2_9BACT|nr:hypothetical protein [Ancylomarina euxinus]MCZ4694703.1 hypothetical protein [Ancylomarina euxinus]MUP16367.1 hypothetical protein [Ancylomarina euxinus]RRG19398.1 hypothetical protein DWB61_15225 [Ancylomarina euxinus]
MNINYNPSVFFEKSADTTYTIKQTGFGDLNTFSLSVKSQYNDWDDYDFMLQTKKRYRLGTYLNIGNWPKFAYNFVEKVFYTNDYNRMQSFNLNSFQNISTIRLDDLLYEGIYSCPTNSTRVAGASDDKIYVFENKDLEKPIEISYDGGGTDDIDHFLFSDNGKIAFSRSGTYHLVDIESKKEMLQIPIDDYPIYSKWAKISTSQDAKFMGVGTHNGLKVYDLGNKADEIFSDTRSYRSVYFNPLNASELYLTFNDNQVLEVRNPADFSLTKTINLESKMVIENIDPVSNKILLTNYKRLFVYDIKSGELELSLPGTESQNWLFNYHLFCNTGCVLNIEKELN